MSSAASKASKSMRSSKRNRPSIAMSKKETGETPETTTSGSTPLFMDEVNSQYQSLSERLARENAENKTASSATGSANPSSTTKKKQKVRWAETAALASTLDAAKANDEELTRSTPLEAISDLFQRKYTVPVFLLVATSIFLLVHLSGRDGNELFSSKNELNHGQGHEVGGNSFSSLQKSRAYNVGVGDGFTSVLFSFVPTPSPSSDETLTPTSEVVLHVTPKVRSFPTPSDAGKDGYEPGWVLVPTTSNGKGDSSYGGNVDFKEGWGYPPGVPTPDPALLLSEAGNYHTGGKFDGAGMNGPFNVELAPDKWGIPQGQPTPDPALLSNVSPVTQKWNFPDGAPTPDPAFLPKGPPSSVEMGKGKPGSGTWGYPPGVPTPNPDLMVEVAPDNTSPTTLKWKIPLGRPTVDNTSPTTLKWNIPLGQPTPDPAMLNGVDKGSPTTLGWNFPPGVPTPDPALLTGVPDTVTWGYPPGVPTPDPALLEGTAVTMTWGYPPGVPTPDPALLSGETPRPTMRQVETGSTPVEEDVDITFKMPDELPPVAPPPVFTLPPIGPKDSGGNVIEVAPPPPVPVIPITVKNPGLPVPQVNTQPYSGGWFRPLSSGTRPVRPGGPRPDRPGRAPTFLGLGQQQGGYIMGGCGGCCGCCGCGGGMMMGGYMGAVPVGDGSSMMVPQSLSGSGSIDARFNLPGLSLSGLPEPQCPWECVIDETVPTKGRSNEDDAIYEIFYTNPLNCCGTIVEIGAGNGEENSPSYFFEYGMNWTAILTEADPISFDLMTKSRTGDKAALMNGAFCQEGSHIYFEEKSRHFQTSVPDQYSSEVTSPSLFQVNETTPKVDCIRLDSDVLAGVDHVNVMIIRVKGDPWAVVRTMDWDIKVDIWVILMEDKPGMLHDTLRAALRLHDYVPSAWEIKLWCETPSNCMQNEVWLRKSFSALPKPLMGLGQSPGLRGSSIG